MRVRGRDYSRLVIIFALQSHHVTLCESLPGHSRWPFDGQRLPNFTTMPKVGIHSNLLALFVTGDLAGVTIIQRSQHRRIFYAKTYPKRVRSPKQNLQRNRFSTAIIEYRALTAEQRNTLDKITRRYRMPMSGYNLWISCYLRYRLDWIEQWATDLNLPW